MQPTEVAIGTRDQFIAGANKRWNRKWQPNVAKDLDELIPYFSHREIISNSRRLYANHGVVKGVIQQKAMYTVGQAFVPRYLGKDTEWKKTATDWLLRWSQLCNISGHDLQTTLYLLSISIDRDGDAFVLLTQGMLGYPQIQVIPAHQVGQRTDEKIIQSGRFKGSKITKGVITQRNGRPIGYRVLGATEAEDRDIPASDMIHIYDPEYPEQTRGLSLFSHAINQFRDMADSTDRELTAQLLLASLAFIEHNPFGGPDETNAVASQFESVDGNPTSVAFDDGTIKFFKSGDGSKLEAVSNNRPSAEWQAFHNRLERIALVGANWPKAMIDAAQGNGTADRISLRQAMRSVEDRQALLKPVAARICTYAIAKAIKDGLLPPNEDFFRWSFSTPPSISIDAGRDSNALREEYKLGIRNLTDILEEQGKSLEDHLYQRATEEAHAILIRQEVEQQYDVTIPVYDMKMLSQSQLNDGSQSQPIEQP